SSGTKPNFQATRFATACAGASCPPSSTSQAPTATSTPTPKYIDDYVVSVSPPATDASSTNQSLIWTVTNRACINIDKVAITVPAGWTFGSDAYSLVNDTTSTFIETWNISGTTFTAPLNNAPAAAPGR